jgi:hypothetical protein
MRRVLNEAAYKAMKGAASYGRYHKAQAVLHTLDNAPYKANPTVYNKSYLERNGLLATLILPVFALHFLAFPVLCAACG